MSTVFSLVISWIMRHLTHNPYASFGNPCSMFLNRRSFASLPNRPSALIIGKVYIYHWASSNQSRSIIKQVIKMHSGQRNSNCRSAKNTKDNRHSLPLLSWESWVTLSKIIRKTKNIILKLLPASAVATNLPDSESKNKIFQGFFPVTRVTIKRRTSQIY